MTRLARALCALYTIAALALTATTITTYNLVPLWVSIVNALASIALAAAISNTYDDAHEIRDIRQQLTNAVRPPADYNPQPAPAATPPVMTPTEQAAFDEIEAHYRKDEAA